MSAAEAEPQAEVAFEAIVDTDRFAEFIDTLTPLLDECKIHLEADGLQVRGVDPANVAMADATLGRDAFESYDADGSLIGVDLNRLDDVIGMADSGQLAWLSLDSETGKLEIEIDQLSYTLALIDPDSIRQEPDIPDLDLPGRFVIEGRDLMRAETAADLVGDHITFGFDVDTPALYFDAQGDTDDVRVELDPDEDVLEGSCDESVSSFFSLDYVGDLCKPINAGDEIEMQLGNEFPTKLTVAFADGEGECTYTLAPRIQSD